MAVALEQFVKQLEESGVISRGKLEGFLPPKAAPKDAQELARELIRSKHLTKYQAQEIYSGRARSLILGNYTILDRIGAGGMGQVFQAEHRRMKRVVALKMLPSGLTKDPVAAARFQREVEAAAKLSHPNIVAAHDADEANGVHFLVMEHVAGSDLSALVKKNGPFPVAQATIYILQAARGLEYAHKKGVVHRDIKPANLLLDAEGTVKILDMGLARIDGDRNAATQAELTGTGAVMGTVDYMAPEQALSTKHADARADIYSLGCTLYYLLTGRPLYDGESLMARLLAHRETPIPLLCDACPDASAELDAVFQRMVAKSVDDRYQAMSEVTADLERCATGNEAPAGAPSVSEMDSGSLTFFKDSLAATANRTRQNATRQLPAKDKPAPSKAAVALKRSYPILLALGGGAGVLLSLVVAFYLLRGDRDAGKARENMASDSAPNPEANVATATDSTVRHDPAPPEELAKPTEDAEWLAQFRDKRTSKPQIPPPAISNEQLAQRLAAVDWKPGSPTPDLPGLVALPAALPGLPAWQIQHATPHGNGAQRWLSPKGNYLVVRPLNSSTAQVRETLSGRIVGIIPSHERHFVWSPDEAYIAILQLPRGALGNGVLEIRRRDGVIVARTKCRGFDDGLSLRFTWSPDGSRVMYMVGAESQQWRVDGTSVASYEKISPSDKGNIRWSPDGKHFLRWESNKNVELFAADGGKPLFTIPYDTALIQLTSVVWHPRGDRFALGGKDSLTEYNLLGEKGNVTKSTSQLVTWSPDGAYQLWINGNITDTAGNKVSTIPAPNLWLPQVNTWLWADPDTIVLLDGYGSPVAAMFFSPAGAIQQESKPRNPQTLFLTSWLRDKDELVTANSSVSFRWNIQGKGNFVKHGGGYPNHTVHWNPSRDTFSIGNDDFVEYTKDGIAKQTLAGYGKGNGRAHSWSSSGNRLGVIYRTDGTSGKIGVWENGQRIATFAVPLPKDDALRPQLSWSPNDRYLVYLWAGLVFDLEHPDKEPLNLVTPPANCSVAWHPTEELLAVLDKNSIRLVGLDGFAKNTISLEGNKAVSEPLWHPDGTSILVGGTLYDRAGKVRGTVPDAVAGQPVWFNGAKGLGVVHWSGSVRIWKSPREKPTEVVLPKTSHRSNLTTWTNSRFVSPSGKYLVVCLHQVVSSHSGLWGGDVAVVDLEAGKVAWTGVGFGDGERVLISDSGKVMAAPEVVDQYVQYVLSYGRERWISLTQRQFAARIGMSPSQQVVQQLLDYGGQIKVRGQDAWWIAADLPDARYLPKPEDVLAVDFTPGLHADDLFVPALVLLPNLERLNLANQAVSDKGLIKLSSVAKLRELNLSATQVSNGIGQWLPANVESLDLSQTSVGNIVLTDLKSSSSLKRLILTGTAVTPEALVKFRAARPDCEVIMANPP